MAFDIEMIKQVYAERPHHFLCRAKAECLSIDEDPVIVPHNRIHDSKEPFEHLPHAETHKVNAYFVAYRVDGEFGGQSAAA